MIRRSILFTLFIYFGISVHADIPRDRKPTEFYFARLQYRGYFGDDNLKNWYTDYPNMDEHLIQILNRVTNIHANAALVKITPELFRFPFAFIVEPEQLNMNDAEVCLIHEWILRGGRIWMDDFHGDEDRIPTFSAVRRIIPDAEFVQIDLAHPLFHVFYDIRELIQVTNDSIASCRDDGCDQWENGLSGKDPAVYCVYSSSVNYSKSPIAILTYNEDIGDGLEWVDNPEYPHEYSLFAFKIAANITTWFLTHD